MHQESISALSLLTLLRNECVKSQMARAVKKTKPIYHFVIVHLPFSILLPSQLALQLETPNFKLQTLSGEKWKMENLQWQMVNGFLFFTLQSHLPPRKTRECPP